MTGLSCRLVGHTAPFSSALTRVWKLLMMPSHCLSAALFCSLKNNVQRILRTSRFRFNASEACWTVLAACANYDSNAVSLPLPLSVPVCSSCSQPPSCVSCLFVRVCVVSPRDPHSPLMLPSFMLISQAGASDFPAGHL